MKRKSPRRTWRLMLISTRAPPKIVALPCLYKEGRVPKTSLCDRLSDVTGKSFIAMTCKLRSKNGRPHQANACALSLEVLLKPTISLRRAQNRPYLDRNAFCGQYSKSATLEPRVIDLSGLQGFQTNVCIGPRGWCRYNAAP